MTLSRKLIVLALFGASLGCGSAGTQPANATSPPAIPPPPSSTPMTTPPSEPPHPLDELFRGYQQKLPEPATMSEGNGATLKCPHHGYITYTLLDATAEKLPVEGDADVARLVHWYRDGDPCLRYIAVEGLLSKIPHDRDQLSLPNMHEPDNYEYRGILVSAKLFLDGKHVAYAPRLFDGVIVSVTPKDFGPTLRGSWKEAITQMYRFQYLVEIDLESVRVTHHKKTPDPKWPDRTTTTKVEKVLVNERQEFVVSGSDETITFMPVTSNVVWFDNGEPHDWHKLERSSP